MTTTTKPAALASTAPARRPGPAALALRQGRLEITQFLRSRESVVFTMGFPVIMILIFAAIFGDEIAPGVSYTQYFITGMIATGLMTVSFQNLGIWIPIERDRGCSSATGARRCRVGSGSPARCSWWWRSASPKRFC